MATPEQALTIPRQELDQETARADTGAVDRVVRRALAIDWEIAFYIVIFVLAVTTRLVNLGDRVMSHDESLHTYYSYQLYLRGDYDHTPLMHGPVLFHATALSYFLFGDSDFSARLYPAILGIIMVMMPWLLFKRWLRKYGAMAASLFILISPMLLYHHRYIREDTPAIFFTMLMVYAIFVYVDGVESRRRQPGWLVLLAAATLLNLASKETAFMYILIFAAFTGFFLLMQLVQGWRSRLHSASVGWAIVGVVGVPALGILGTLAAAAFGITERLSQPLRLIDTQIGSTPIVVEFSAETLQLLGTIIFGVPVAIFIGTVLMAVGVLLWRFVLNRPVTRAVDALGQYSVSFFKMAMAGILVGAVATLVMINVFAIIQPENIQRAADIWNGYYAQQATAPGAPTMAPPTEPTPQAYVLRLVLWSGAMVMGLAGILIGTALVKFRGRPSLPWRDILMVIGIAAIVFAVLIFLEERARLVPNVSSEVRTATVFDNMWVYGPWVVGILALAGIAFLRFRTSFWAEMRRYPMFDVVMLLGTLVLPWSAALPIFQAGYPLDGSYTDVRVINASLTALIPFFAVAIAAGLTWRPGVWLVCTATFYALFAFFYTTVFTNPTGVATGLVGSLGYWLAQQGVKRGSQPQYYYMLIEMPVYEYLTVIGASAAGILGAAWLWAFRARRFDAADAQERERAEREAHELHEGGPEGNLSPEPVALVESAAEPTDAPTAAETRVSMSTAELLVPVEPEEAELEAELDGALEEGAPEEVKAKRDAEVDAINLDEAIYEGPRKREWREGSGEAYTGVPQLHPALYSTNDADAYWRDIEPDERLVRPMFLVFVGFWAVMITYALTLAGEKMPWLTTHITLPMALLSGWYVGKVIEGLDWQAFRTRLWAILLLAPVFLIGLANVVGPFVFNQPPFAGLERAQQMRTFTWIGALVLTAVTGYGMYWLATTPRRNKSAITLFRLGEIQIGYVSRRQLNWSQALRVLVVGIFALLAVLTARHAWMAAFINYDQATEYLVYAHGAPGNKVIVNYLTQMSQRLTDGMNIQVAYDDKFSWPGSWYMRQFPSAVFLGDAQNASGWENYQAIVIDTDKTARLEPQFADRFYRFDMIRLWWPMQDYFGLTMQRIDNALGDGGMRQGLWDIWWSRSYDAYGEAKARMTGSSPDEFDIDKWPVAERMAFYVRKDVAAQLWDFGVGAARVSGLPADPFNTLRCDTCSAETAFTAAPGAFNAPRGVAVGPDGNIYVADTQNSRIVVLAPNGQMIRTFGTLSVVNEADPSGAPLGTLREPWGIAVDTAGRVIVADTWNHRIQIFTAEGEPVTAWGTFERVDPNFSLSGSATGFYGPRDVKVDAQDRIYVADTGNKRVRVYDSNGNFLMDIGHEGALPGQLLEPVGLAINNATGELFIASTWNKRIDVFSLEGSFLRSWDVPAWYGNTATADSGNRPYMALDRTGRYLFVTDPDSARVLVYDTNGTPMLQFGRLGSAPYGLGQFGVLGGIAFDDENRLVMADAGAARIVRFASGAFPGLMVEVEAPPEALPTEAIQPTPTGRVF